MFVKFHFAAGEGSFLPSHHLILFCASLILRELVQPSLPFHLRRYLQASSSLGSQTPIPHSYQWGENYSLLSPDRTKGRSFPYIQFCGSYVTSMTFFDLGGADAVFDPRSTNRDAFPWTNLSLFPLKYIGKCGHLEDNGKKMGSSVNRCPVLCCLLSSWL